jgi:hypothetical protein
LILITLALLLPPTLAKCDISISVFEVSAATTTNNCLNLGTLSVTKTSAATGVALPPINDYSVTNYHLRAGKTELADAVDILAQARFHEMDIVVVRNEYNSFSNPLRLLFAFAGHPVQVSEVIVFALRNHVIVGHWRIARAASSYKWEAVLRSGV